MNDNTNFEFAGQTISFEFADGNRMVNATAMASIFGKRASEFLRLQSTKDFILLLDAQLRREAAEDDVTEVLRIVKDGKPKLQGIWIDERLALKFAAWLSPNFEYWMYSKVHELFKTGKTQLKEVSPAGFSSTLGLLAKQWEEQEKFYADTKKKGSPLAPLKADLEAKILSIDDKYYTVEGYCAANKILCPIEYAKSWGRKAVALSQKGSVQTGTAYDERFGKVRTYHEVILKHVIKKGPVRKK